MSDSGWALFARCGGRSAETASSISEASLLREERKLPVELDGSDLLFSFTPNLAKGFGLEPAAGVMLILGRDGSAAGVVCGFGVEVGEGFEDSGSDVLFSSDLEEAGVEVPSLARRRARIWGRHR